MCVCVCLQYKYYVKTILLSNMDIHELSYPWLYFYYSLKEKEKPLI